MSIFEKNYGSEYSDAITMVHKEFKEAGDKLFNEASEILESKKVLNMPKYKRLKELGSGHYSYYAYEYDGIK